jgi:hypothetical protein
MHVRCQLRRLGSMLQLFHGAGLLASRLGRTWPSSIERVRLFSRGSLRSDPKEPESGSSIALRSPGMMHGGVGALHHQVWHLIWRSCSQIEIAEERIRASRLARYDEGPLGARCRSCLA